MKIIGGIITGGAVLLGISAHAALFEQYAFDNINQKAPDNQGGSGFGLINQQTISSSILYMQDLNVVLNISGGLNGDLLVTLSHDSGFSVLLNRVGRAASSLQFPEYGYSDSGLSNITLDDAAVNGDIHVYRLTLNGAHNIPLGGALTGTWAPDGRTTAAASTQISDDRTALLSSFNGLNANGVWTLAISDFAETGESTLVSWGLQLTGVPEPRTYALATGVALMAFASMGRRIRRQPHP